MLRSAEYPLDAYRYLAGNAMEVTRVGTWDLEELAPQGTKKPDVEAVRMTYRPRDDGNDEPSDKVDVAGEEAICAAREGELASYPRIWGLPDALISHEGCLAKGGDACVYVVRWKKARSGKGPVLGATSSAAVCGGTVALAGNWIAGSIAAVLGGALGGGAGLLWDRSTEEKSIRAFERNRIAALERGLELRGEVTQTPGELTGQVLGGKYRIGRKNRLRRPSAWSTRRSTRRSATRSP